MTEPSDLKPEFDEMAAALPQTDFANFLQARFDGTTARNVFAVFQEMGLPAPEKQREFLDATGGGLVFVSRYGLVIRIEYTDAFSRLGGFDRFNDSAWVLQPLATIDAGMALIEICPGCHMEKNDANSDDLVERLRKQMINFWDRGIRNIGRVPVKTPSFPEGIPVVIDRLAVAELTLSLENVRRGLKKLVRRQPAVVEITAEALEAAAALEELYGPLRQAFSAAWPDYFAPANARKMQKFWALCRSYVAEGKLVAGWDEIDRNSFREDAMKTLAVSYIAESYENRLKSMPSAAAAVPQSPRRPG